MSRQCGGGSDGLRSRYGCCGVPFNGHTEDHVTVGWRTHPRVTIIINFFSLRQPFSFTVQSTVLNIIQILTQISSAPATRTRLPEQIIAHIFGS